MLRRVGLIFALVALLAAMLPAGATLAKDAGKSDCKKDGWTEWVRVDGSAFADQSECVSYVAEGGTLMPPTTFQSTCQNLGGTYQSNVNGWEDFCAWQDLSFSDWTSYQSLLWPLCPDPTQPHGAGGQWSETGLDTLACNY